MFFLINFPIKIYLLPCWVLTPKKCFYFPFSSINNNVTIDIYEDHRFLFFSACLIKKEQKLRKQPYRRRGCGPEEGLRARGGPAGRPEEGRRRLPAGRGRGRRWKRSLERRDGGGNGEAGRWSGVVRQRMCGCAYVRECGVGASVVSGAEEIRLMNG